MTDVCCVWQNLIQAGFNDIMSSWKNRMTVDAKWSFNAGGGGTQLCMNAGSQNPQLSGANNDLGLGPEDLQQRLSVLVISG